MRIFEGEPPRVLIVDNDFTSCQLEVAAYGAQEAGWQPLPFDDVVNALEELNYPRAIHAAVIACRVGQGSFSEYTAPRLVDMVHNQGIPFALLTAGTELGDTEIKVMHPNEVIFPTKNRDTAKSLEIWLRRLRS